MPKPSLKLSAISDDDFINFVKTSTYWMELVLKCGYKKERLGVAWASKQRIIKRMQSLNLSYDHLKSSSGNRGLNPLQNDVMSKISDETFTEYVQSSRSWYELILKCGYKQSKYKGVGKDAKTMVQKRIERQQLSCSHLKLYDKSQYVKPVEKLTTKRRHRRELHRKLQESGRLYMCEWCRCENMTLWNGQWLWRDWPVTLEIDHIRGRQGTDEDDNIDNLRYLCPMCHSQTWNYKGRALKGKTYSKKQKTS